MSDEDALSFVRGIFAGAIHDELLFPFPTSLEDRDPDEARTVLYVVRLLAFLLILYAIIDKNRVPRTPGRGFPEDSNSPGPPQSVRHDSNAS